MNKFLTTLLIFSAVFSTSAQHNEISKKSLEDLASVTIQHGGRLKPFDTFARTTLLSFYEKSALNHKEADYDKKLKKSALEWLAGVILNPKNAYKENIFKEVNPEVIEALGIEPRKPHYYNFEELSKALTTNRANIENIAAKEAKDRTLVEKQLMALQIKASVFFDISRSLSAFNPNITIKDPDLAKAFGIEANTSCSYMFFIRKRQVISSLLNTLRKKPEKQYALIDLALINLIRELNSKMSDQNARSIALISPEAGDTKWLSPWETLDGRPLTENLEKSLTSLEKSLNALKNNDEKAFEKNISQFKQLQIENPSSTLELTYNKVDFFTKALAFFGLALIAIVFTMLFKTLKKTSLRKVSYIAAMFGLSCGLFLQGAGIVCRMIIMSRPPVSTLYETTLFAAFIAVLMGFLLEIWDKKGLGLLVAAITGVGLNLLSFKYLADGDTMGMLVAVLNSNFWLATHVVTIIIGYGSTLFAGLLGHIYLIKSLSKADKTDLADLYKVMIGSSLIALLFTTLGTILGGIWADQSWGRFWGWDPKENGALLIVLCLLVVVHGRISGKFRGIGYASGLVLTNISVGIAWFGVNLLQVGLHSYGFDDKTFNALAIFCFFELVFGIFLGLIVYKRPVQAYVWLILTAGNLINYLYEIIPSQLSPLASFAITETIISIVVIIIAVTTKNNKTSNYSESVN